MLKFTLSRVPPLGPTVMSLLDELPFRSRRVPPLRIKVPLPMLVPLVLTSNVPELMVVVAHPVLPVALTRPNGDIATTIFPPPVMAPRFVSVVDVLLGTDPLGKFNPTPVTVRFPVNVTPPKYRPPD